MIGADVEVWGAHAERFAHRHAIAMVAGLFARSLHLAARGDLMCIGESGIGNGPLNACVSRASWQRLLGVLPAAGTPVHLLAGRITIGGATLATRGARAWHPPPWPIPTGHEDVRAPLHDLTLLAQVRAPSEGLARLALGFAVAEAPLARAAGPRLQRLHCWLAARLGGEHAPAPTDLLGLGPGLTPSGDDLLGGALLALHAIGRGDAAHDLYGALRTKARTATCCASQALLAAAAEGQGFEPLHTLINALLRRRPIGRALLAVARVGHSSGWDALAGVVLVLRAASAR
jgi:hypothetical protein